MSETSISQDLDTGAVSLDRDLRRDKQRVAPFEEVTERPDDIVFFEGETWWRLLTELAYLPDCETALDVGLSCFLQETQNDPAFREYSAALEALSDIAARGEVDPSDDLFAVDALLEALVESLSFAVGTSDVEIAGRLPNMGEISVWSRIVQARQDRLGTLLNTAVGCPWSEEDLLSLRRLNRLLGGQLDAVFTTNMEELVHLCGNADAMIARLRARDPGGFLVAKSGSFPGPRDTFYRRLRVGTDSYFSAAPLINLSPALQRVRIDGELTHRIAKPIHGDGESAWVDPSNKLGLRLVQIKLWQLGFYDDSIDGIFGPNTISALLEALEIYGGAALSVVRLDFIRRLGNGQVAINLHGLDKLVFSASKEWVPSAEEKAGFVAQAGAQIVEKKALEAPSSSAFFLEAPTLRVDARKEFLSRVGHRARGLFRSAGQALRSLVPAVKRGLQNMVLAVDRVLGPVRSALRAAFSQIDKVRSFLALAIRTWRTFFLKAPLTIGDQEEGFVSVQFSLDQDVRVLLFNDPSDRILDAYRKGTGRLYRTMRLSLNAGITIIKLLGAVATWRGRIRLILELTALLQKRLPRSTLPELA